MRRSFGPGLGQKRRSQGAMLIRIREGGKSEPRLNERNVEDLLVHSAHVLVHVGGVLGEVAAVVAAVAGAEAVGLLLAGKVVGADVAGQGLGRVEEPHADVAVEPLVGHLRLLELYIEACKKTRGGFILEAFCHFVCWRVDRWTAGGAESRWHRQRMLSFLSFLSFFLPVYLSTFLPFYLVFWLLFYSFLSFAFYSAAVGTLRHFGHSRIQCDLARCVGEGARDSKARCYFYDLCDGCADDE
jgi:hypothetical protein